MGQLLKYKERLKIRRSRSPGNISLITTCKGRLENLRESLPSMTMANWISEIIVVDYDCPDGTKKYVDMNYRKCKCIKTHHKRFFNLSHARNIGAKFSTGDILLFVDADLKIKRRIIWTNDCGAIFFQFGRKGFGTSMIQRDIYYKIKGYNETTKGWGYEDVDFKIRTSQVCKVKTDDAQKYFSMIDHNNKVRMRYSKTQSKNTSGKRNRKLLKDFRDKYGHIGNHCAWGVV